MATVTRPAILPLSLAAILVAPACADHGEPGLVAILGGCQPNAAYVLEPIAVVIGNRELGLVGRVVRDEEAMAAEVLSVPYVLLSVDAGDLTIDRPINLQLEGADR